MERTIVLLNNNFRNIGDSDGMRKGRGWINQVIYSEGVICTCVKRSTNRACSRIGALKRVIIDTGNSDSRATRHPRNEVVGGSSIIWTSHSGSNVWT